MANDERWVQCGATELIASNPEPEADNRQIQDERRRWMVNPTTVSETFTIPRQKNLERKKKKPHNCFVAPITIIFRVRSKVRSAARTWGHKLDSTRGYGLSRVRIVSFGVRSWPYSFLWSNTP